MYIKSVELKNFRNYKELEVDFHKNINIFLGQNAQGKTNLLESLYITSMGKSFRTNKDKELICFGEDFCRVKVEAMKQDDLVVEIAVNKEGKKGIKIDGVKAKKTSELLENIYIVIFSPEDLKIVKEEPEKRRRFVDRELCQLKPSYYNNLNQYKKILAQRNTYLKERDPKIEVLDIWDLKLAEYGGTIFVQRNEFIKKLNKISKEIHRNITNQKEELLVLYEPNIRICGDKKEQADYFYEEIKKNREKDLKVRTTGKGPHKDDLKISANNIDLRNFGSQGQQRSAALSLKLSEMQLIKEETEEAPILLLDDVMSELDHERQQFLIQTFEDVQIFITTTELSDEVKDALPERKTFYVKEGKIEKYEM